MLYSSIVWQLLHISGDGTLFYSELNGLVSARVTHCTNECQTSQECQTQTEMGKTLINQLQGELLS